MGAAAAAAPRLADERKESTIRALGMDPLDAQIRQVFFFDTPGLDLDARGIVVRARRVQGKGDDAVLKLRPVVAKQLSTKCALRDAFDVAAATRAFLSERGVDLSGEQATKTRKALEFFAARLRAA